jgi:hypothetical protein
MASQQQRAEIAAIEAAAAEAGQSAEVRDSRREMRRVRCDGDAAALRSRVRAGRRRASFQTRAALPRKRGRLTHARASIAARRAQASSVISAFNTLVNAGKDRLPALRDQLVSGSFRLVAATGHEFAAFRASAARRGAALTARRRWQPT